MPTPRHEQIKAILVEAMDKPAPERRAFVERACGGDDALRAEVDAFLSASEEVGDFLASPIVDFSAVSLQEGPGTKIGRYKLLQLIGEGGFGNVFMAEQEYPVRRKVALKIIKLGMDTKQVIARFEAERQALAMMEHPNIAKVLDAGATQTGRPYFVMELVHGIPITEYCDTELLSVRQRVELFLQVCQAIQHAHQKGIIHRDIKPGNVLVTVLDGKAVPKIIDFGIAKATHQRLTEKTLFTEFKHFIGTPAYMSPEQAQMSGTDIDTRSDIYSLGVLLYELLTGTTPFDPKTLRSVAYEEIRRIIREVEPPKPSTRLSGLGETLSSIAQRRQTEPAKLSQGMKGELDWIVMKCLEKDRKRRYETANSLADDIQRHLKNEPILARPPTFGYRLRKTVGRNKLAFLAAGIVIASLFTGLGLSTWAFFREEQARRQADVERKNAEAQAAKSQQVARFLEDMLNGVRPAVARGRDTALLREILDNTARRVGAELKDRPDVESELLLTIGRVYFALGEYPKAEVAERESLAIRGTLFGDQSIEVATTLSCLAAVLGEEENYVGEESIARQSMAIQKKILGPRSLDLARSPQNLGVALESQNKTAEAAEAYSQALAMRRKLLRPDDPDVAISLMGVANILNDQGKLAEAEAAYRQVLAIQEKSPGGPNPDIEITLDNLANLLISEGKLADAEPVARQVLAFQEKFFGDAHPHVVRSLWILTGVLQSRGKAGEAVPFARKLVAIQTQRLGGDHLNTALAMGRLADLLIAQGKLPEAESLYASAEIVYKKAPITGRSDVAWAVYNYASFLRDHGAPAEAEAVYRESLDLLTAAFGASDRSVAVALSSLGDLTAKDGNWAEAESLHRRAVEIERGLPAGQDRATLLRWSLGSLAQAADRLDRAGKSAEAAALRKEFSLPNPPKQPAATRPSNKAAIPGDSHR